MKKNSKILLGISSSFLFSTLVGCNREFQYYTVKFDCKDVVDIIPSQRIKSGGKVSKPTITPVAKDSTKIFDNYYLNGKTFDFNNYSINSNITINVTVKDNYHTVYFDPTEKSKEEIKTVKVLNSKSLKETYPGEKQPTPSPKAADYHFYNWLDEDNKPFDFTTPILKDTYLHANYVENWIEITCERNIDIENSGYELKAKIDGNDQIVDWIVPEECKDIVTIESNKIKATENTSGGFAYFYAKKTIDSKEYYGLYGVTVGSFSKLDETQLIHNRASKKTSGIIDKVVIPAYYYGSDWCEISSIQSYGFADCNQLTSVILPNTITTINDSAFYRCTNLNNVTLNENLQVISEYAFMGCLKLNEITIPSSVNTIQKYAFHLSGFDLTDNAKVYFNKPDSWVYSPNNILISYSLLSDPEKAAYCVSSLYANDIISRNSSTNPLLNFNKVTLEKNNSYISHANIYSNQNVTYSSSSESIAAVNKGRIEAVGVGETTIKATNPDGLVSECNVTVEASENLIEKSVSEKHGGIACKPEAKSNLDYVAIPESIKYEDGGETKTTEVKYIADSGFDYTSLKTIYINENIESVGYGAFSNSKLEQAIFSLSSNCTTIGEKAFANCQKLNFINLPDEKITSIGTAAFTNCYSLTGITLPSNSNFNVLEEALFANCTGLEAIVIPSNITEIKDNVFNGCNKLRNIIYLNTVEELRKAVGGRKSTIFTLVKTDSIICSDGTVKISEL